jgi:glutamyl-tRNA synthetase
MEKIVRTRFAPSPTGGLHLGGVRTALYSYLFAKRHQGQFILRIEDTDQNRYVSSAEAYIIDCLTWCGISADEGPHNGGQFAPYRQSERKDLYKKYAMQLIDSGHAYYAFDTSEELEQMREGLKTSENPSPQYDKNTRMQMRNSLVLSKEEVDSLLNEGMPHVIRIKVPNDISISFEDMIRGEIKNDSNLLDDKVLLKADGMPTYHLAVVVDDFTMKITHAFRGEEWLPSAPIHILLWEYLGWKNEMPQWAHLPLILKPDGHGKLSKRDGERLGFPVFAMNWTDPQTHETATGFKEMGFMPEAFINLLALLGWSSGEEKEIFTKEELIQSFAMDRVHKGGAKFDFEKAKWFNHQWIMHAENDKLLPIVKSVLATHDIYASGDALLALQIGLVKDRCVLTQDFIQQLAYFYKAPLEIDVASIEAKWSHEKNEFFRQFVEIINDLVPFDEKVIEEKFKALAAEKNIKVGELQLPLRIMLVGAKFGPSVFVIAELIGKISLKERIIFALQKLN